MGDETNNRWQQRVTINSQHASAAQASGLLNYTRLWKNVLVRHRLVSFLLMCGTYTLSTYKKTNDKTRIARTAVVESCRMFRCYNNVHKHMASII